MEVQDSFQSLDFDLWLASELPYPERDHRACSVRLLIRLPVADQSHVAPACRTAKKLPVDWPDATSASCILETTHWQRLFVRRRFDFLAMDPPAQTLYAVMFII
ncbi:hypothetical protein V2G26_012019 [Clonostachys chloroleuca]